MCNEYRSDNGTSVAIGGCDAVLARGKCAGFLRHLAVVPQVTEITYAAIRLSDPNTVLAGDWHADALDGPGVETVGDRERYEGGFRASQRTGYGLLTGPDGVAHAGRWEGGKLKASCGNTLTRVR